MNLLTVKGLTKRYPKFTLQDVSFSLGQGRIMVSDSDLRAALTAD